MQGLVLLPGNSDSFLVQHQKHIILPWKNVKNSIASLFQMALAKNQLTLKPLIQQLHKPHA